MRPGKKGLLILFEAAAPFFRRRETCTIEKIRGPLCCFIENLRRTALKEDDRSIIFSFL